MLFKIGSVVAICIKINVPAKLDAAKINVKSVDFILLK